MQKTNTRELKINKKKAKVNCQDFVSFDISDLYVFHIYMISTSIIWKHFRLNYFIVFRKDHNRFKSLSFLKIH